MPTKEGEHGPAGGCLSDATLVEFMEGRLRRAAMERLHRHISHCSYCFALVENGIGGPPKDRVSKQPGDAAGLAQREAIAREEHATNVLRLRQIVLLSIWVWPSFFLLDLGMVKYLQAGSLTSYLVLRIVGVLVAVTIWLRLTFLPAPSPRRFVLIELVAFGMGNALISLMCLQNGGMRSPYTSGILLVLCGHGITMLLPWWTGLFRTGLLAVVHPVVLLSGVALSPTLRGQFTDPQAWAYFLVGQAFLLGLTLILVIGGHSMWATRRQLFASRKIARYQLRECIGSGGMGDVWSAYDPNVKHDVALKILRPDRSVSNEAVARFEREVQATAKLSHPNTVRVFDYGSTDDGLWYYVMELLEGTDLATLLQREGPLSLGRALRFVSQAARAMAEAHRKGIVHRDLKPANLFVTSPGGENDFIKVIDFGIAHWAWEGAATLTRENWIGGTPAYMAPEVASGQPADTRSDVYALGAVLYHSLAGAPPFEDASTARLLSAQKGEMPILPSVKRGESLPMDMEQLVMRCLEKDPDRRYASAVELASALATLALAYSADAASRP